MYRLHSNGAYWQVVFDEGGATVRRSLGSKAALTKRAAQRLIEEMVEKRIATGDRSSTTIGQWCNRYITLRQREITRATMLIHQRVCESLIEFFGDDRALGSIERADMSDWRASVRENREESTACKYSRTAKVIFARAVDEEILDKSPACKLRATAPIQDPFSRRLVTAAEIDQALRPTGIQRLPIAIAWHAGLRTSEVVHLRPADILFDSSRVIVRPRGGVQTSKQRGREVRLEPELAQILRDSDMDQRQTVCGLIEANAVNLLSRNVRSACEQAGVTPFTLRDLRRARDTRWHMEFPSHVCCAWLGHSESVARQHYLAVPDEYYPTNREEPDAT